MAGCELISRYFSLSDLQVRQFEALDALYRDWNSKINVISRKDIDNLYEHHVLHSLSLAKYMTSCGLDSACSSVLDFGTGGGFPGIPLAIMFPSLRFRLIDSIGKKVRVAQAVGDAIGLSNCEYAHCRGQEDSGCYDLIVSRAVMPLGDIAGIFRSGGRLKSRHGIVCLKGGDLGEELSSLPTLSVPVSDYFHEDWFAEKFIVHLVLSPPTSKRKQR